MEGRFDEAAGQPGRDEGLIWEPAGGYGTVDNEIVCQAGPDWMPGMVMSMQGYDGSAETLTTFSFPSVGIFENSDADSSLMDFEPQGMSFPRVAAAHQTTKELESCMSIEALLT